MIIPDIVLFIVIYLFAFWVQIRVSVKEKIQKNVSWILNGISMLTLVLAIVTPLSFPVYYGISVLLLFLNALVKYIWLKVKK